MSNRTAVLHMRNSVVWVAIASLIMALLLPILLGTQATVNAAQILDRRIDMQSSQVNFETVYNVDFEVPTGSTIGGFRVEFCNESPIPGADCTASTVEGTNVPELDADGGSAITITNFAFGATLGSTTDASDICTAPGLDTAHGAGANTTYFDIVCDTGDTAPDLAETITSGEEFIHFQVNNVDNPSNAVNDGFYARIYTFENDGGVGDTNQPIATYVATAPPLGNYEGGIALSTAEQITIEARVQETLTFTVGVDAAADDCAAPAGSAVELGVLTTTINLASTHGFALTPNTDVACAEVTTNAANGVNVSYVGDNLAVGATSCADADTDVETNNVTTDLCINRDTDASGNVINAGAEQWGLGVSNNAEYGSITNVMTATAAYDIGVANEYSFTPNAVTSIATSAGVLDQATIEIDVAGTASITTPTGVYDTTLTFIATATF